MNIRMLFLAPILLSMAIQPVFAEPTASPAKQMTAKQKVIKAAKIAGYGTEFAASAFTLCVLNFPAENDTPLILMPLTHVQNEDSLNALGSTAMNVAFFGSFGHSSYGLYKELKPLAKTLMNKIKNKVNVPFAAPLIAKIKELKNKKLNTPKN